MLGPISGKVTASTVATGLSTLIFSIVAPHIVQGQLSPDIEGLIQAAIAAGITFGAGYLAKHRTAEVIAQDAAAVVSIVAGAAPVPASANDQPVA